jgi:hypothetical protein
MYQVSVSVPPHFNGSPPKTAFQAMRMEQMIPTGRDQCEASGNRIISMIDFIWTLLLGGFDGGFNDGHYSLSSNGVAKVKKMFHFFIQRFEPSLYHTRLAEVTETFEAGGDLVELSYTYGIYTLLYKQIKTLSMFESRKVFHEEVKDEKLEVLENKIANACESWELHFLMFLVSPIVLCSIASATLPDYDFTSNDFGKAKTKSLLSDLTLKDSRHSFRQLLISSQCSSSNVDLLESFASYQKSYPSPQYEPSDFSELLRRVFTNRL